MYIRLFVLLWCLLPLTLLGQFRRDQFGKNRIQHSQFEWKFISSANFDVYYYGEHEGLAKYAAEYAENEFSQITELVGFSPYAKTKIMVYANMSDLRQHNIGVKLQSFANSGQTRFVRSEIEVAFPGSHHAFKRELARSIADVLVFEMMYGGSLKDILQSSYLLNLPEWFMPGISKYAAEGWSVEMDDYMREYLSQPKPRKIETLTDREAALIGQSVWNFVAEQYGRQSIANILSLTRLVRNEESAIQNTLGVPFAKFIEAWRNYYQKNSIPVAGQMFDLPDSSQLIRLADDEHLASMSLRPDGRLLATSVVQKWGRFRISLTDLQTKTSYVLFERGSRSASTLEVDKKQPLIRWRDANTLVAVLHLDGKQWLYQFDTRKPSFFQRLFAKGQRTKLDQIDQVQDFSFSPDGELMLMSATRQGKNDLYVLNLRSNQLTQLTNDIFDDLEPHFVRGTKDIVFSSNRTTDTLAVAAKATFKDTNENFNLFRLNPQQKTLQRLTNVYNTCVRPVSISEDELLFVSDQRGIFHLYRYVLKEGFYHQVTRYARNIRVYDAVPGAWVGLATWQGASAVYYFPQVNFAEQTFSDKTNRQTLLDYRLLEMLKKRKQQLEKAEQERLNNLEKEKEQKETGEAEKNFPQFTDEDEIDTDNYPFSTPYRNNRRTFLDKFKSKTPATAQGPKDVKTTKPELYENRFTVDNVTTDLLIDPLRQFGFYIDMKMTDLMENHKFNTGLFFSGNFNNASFFGEYEYLRRRVDFKLRFERQHLSVIRNPTLNQDYNLNMLEATVSYPFNINTRISVSPFMTSTRYTNKSVVNLPLPDRVAVYGGFNAELVYDNSAITGMNMMQGTRFKARYEHYVSAESANRDFSVLTLDGRHYQKIHRSLIFATRLSYGIMNTGSAVRQRFALGGMDNWIGNRTDIANTEDQLYVSPDADQLDRSYFLFTPFVTNLRGFNYNRMNGTNFLLWNGELRVPLVKYFYKGTITSNFFRNLQLVGFCDVGTAWSGLSPFNRQNSINTSVINQGAFNISVSNFQNPFLIGYGFGARTMLLGYYAKLDVGWGQDAGIVRDPRVYFTLGYDF